MKDLVRYGCSRKDFLSCYNYFYIKGFSKEEMKLAKANILEQCKGELSSERKGICEYAKKVDLERLRK